MPSKIIIPKKVPRAGEGNHGGKWSVDGEPEEGEAEDGDKGPTIGAVSEGGSEEQAAGDKGEGCEA